jgi:hypothetical protein
MGLAYNGARHLLIAANKDLMQKSPGRKGIYKSGASSFSGRRLWLRTADCRKTRIKCPKSASSFQSAVLQTSLAQGMAKRYK